MYTYPAIRLHTRKHNNLALCTYARKKAIIYQVTQQYKVFAAAAAAAATNTILLPLHCRYNYDFAAPTPTVLRVPRILYRYLVYTTWEKEPKPRMDLATPPPTPGCACNRDCYALPKYPASN